MTNSANKFICDIKPSKKHIFIGLFIFFLLGITIKSLGILINITSSMPLGIYIRTDGPFSRGDIIALCLSEPYQRIGIRRGYLTKGYTCHGADPLIKQVIAIPGDVVVLDDRYIQVNGMAYHCLTRYTDSLGRVLSTYPRGCYKNTLGYWLIGTHSVDSWDSRYWGSIDTNQILYKLRPLLILT